MGLRLSYRETQRSRAERQATVGHGKPGLQRLVTALLTTNLRSSAVQAGSEFSVGHTRGIEKAKVGSSELRKGWLMSC